MTQEKRDKIWWYVKYLLYCNKYKINNFEQTFEEYIETMKKVQKWVEENGMLS